MSSEGPRRRDWFTPLLCCIIAAPWAVVDGRRAESLGLPTAWFAQTSHWWLVVFVVISFVIPSRRLARALSIMGISSMMYAPLLLHAGTSQILLTRVLSPRESADFRDRFKVPFILSYSEGKRGSLRMRHGQFSDEMRSHLECIGALNTKD